MLTLKGFGVPMTKHMSFFLTGSFDLHFISPLTSNLVIELRLISQTRAERGGVVSIIQMMQPAKNMCRIVFPLRAI